MRIPGLKNEITKKTLNMRDFLIRKTQWAQNKGNQKKMYSTTLLNKMRTMLMQLSVATRKGRWEGMILKNPEEYTVHLILGEEGR